MLKQWETKNGYKIIRILTGRSNVFLVKTLNMNILIDTSVKRKRNKLIKSLKLLNVNNLDYLILSHTHYDHTENAQFIKTNYGAIIIVHSAESEYLTSGISPLPNGTNFLTKYIINTFGKWFSELKKSTCEYDIAIDNDQVFNNIDKNIQILHTPGHSQGSVSVVVDDEIAIVGDTMFGVFKWSVFPPYSTNPSQMVQSWHKLLQTNCTTFIQGHGSAISRHLVAKCYENKRKLYLSYNKKSVSL